MRIEEPMLNSFSYFFCFCFCLVFERRFLPRGKLGCKHQCGWNKMHINRLMVRNLFDCKWFDCNLFTYNFFDCNLFGCKSFDSINSSVYIWAVGCNLFGCEFVITICLMFNGILFGLLGVTITNSIWKTW